MDKKVRIAIIGGGVAGSTISLYLSKLGINITLFEKNSSLVSGPPICHLHSGGNLYREIDDNACIRLLRESIDLLKLYPNSIDYRPTILATPKSDDIEPISLLPRLKLLKKEYQKLIDEDITNSVLCDKENYYKIYNKDEILAIKKKDIKKSPNGFDDWIIPFAKNIDLDKFKFPIIIVQEYGLNIFRLSATLTLLLNNIKNATIKTNTEVRNIIKSNDKYILEYNNNREEFDYVINSAGFKTGTIDDMIGVKRDSLVEFKSAYVTKWQDSTDIWPEVIFFGKRGTPEGMGQFTPYPNGYFQIHGMTKDITLFDNGLVKNSNNSSQPILDKKFITKIEKKWNKEDIDKRTQKAINHIKQYIPSFQNVQVASKPLYGAQQIPGNNANLRTADVTFDGFRYARCEIVKASSVLNMSDLIVQNLIKIGFIDKKYYKAREFLYNIDIDDKEISKMAQKITKDREYPKSLAFRINETNRC
ncbi:hypothetical protein MNB_SV-15-1021 [hydrothermal vent metagenome]|uniref:FAD dependent oxidoreductase domain-containing protein n=1 Tax=hydrothermal vent metagenome TaxID=652676 RepID=A0A1W1ELK8_9ZZZZ